MVILAIIFCNVCWIRFLIDGIDIVEDVSECDSSLIHKQLDLRQRVKVYIIEQPHR